MPLPKKYTTRNSPPFPANQFCGKRKKGNDGFLYESRANKNGVCTWRKVSAAKKKPLEFEEWINEAKRRGLLLKMSDIQKMQIGKSYLLATSLEQVYIIGSGESPHPSSPKTAIAATAFFKVHKETYTHMGAYGILYGISYAPDGPFYDEQGWAALGSGSDTSMLWKNVAKMPPVYIA